MNTIIIGSTTIYRADLRQDVGDGEGALSRRREQETVGAMLLEIFGPRVILEHDSDGAPRLAYTDTTDELPLPFISISHSCREVVIAVDDDTPVGVDIEHWRNSLMKVASRFLTPPQAELYNSSQLLLRAWAAKEAIFKAVPTVHGTTLIDMPLPLSTTGGTVSVGLAGQPAADVDVHIVESSANTCIVLARLCQPSVQGFA